MTDQPQQRRTDQPQLGKLLVEGMKWIPLIILAYNFVAERTENRITTASLRKDVDTLQAQLGTDVYVKHAVQNAHRDRDLKALRNDVDHLLKIFSGVDRGEK